MVPGRTTGDRAPMFEEIRHDAECPVPGLIARAALSAGPEGTREASPRDAAQGEAHE